MKIKIGFLALLMLAGTITTFAQGGGGGFQQRTPEERSKRSVDTLVSLFKLDAAATTAVTTVFVDFNKAQDKMRADMQAGGDREAMMAARTKLVAERDEKLKKTLSADQFKEYKEKIEPAMTPARRGPGGGGQ